MSRFEHIAPWYEALFPARPVQLDFLESARPEGIPGRWADLACGTGQQLEGLADRGLQVWGLDLDPDMLARLASRRPDLAGRVARGRMERAEEVLLPLTGERVGVAYCIGNSLVQVTEDATIRQALESFRRLLVPGGVLAVQIVNFDRVMDGEMDLLPPITREVPGKGSVTLERHYMPSGLPGCLRFRTRLRTPDGTLEREHDLRALLLSDLEGLLDTAGLTPTGRYGDYSREPWSPASPATIVEAVGAS